MTQWRSSYWHKIESRQHYPKRERLFPGTDRSEAPSYVGFSTEELKPNSRSSWRICKNHTINRLAPADPRTHLALGLALARSGQKEQARTELEKAVELAKADVRFRNQEIRARQELERMGF
jgi:tetratricopeptide (TPR) repeat protein